MNVGITRLGWVVIAVLLSAGCASKPPTNIMSGPSQVELRSYQTRAFDTTDRTMMLRSVIATLQDLDVRAQARQGRARERPIRLRRRPQLGAGGVIAARRRVGGKQFVEFVKSLR